MRNVVIILLVMAVGWKVALAAMAPASEQTAAEKLDHVLTIARSAGLSESWRGELTADGVYTGSTLQAFGCNGVLAVVPILRNAEIIGLSSLFAGTPSYLIDGEIYDEFPELPMWLWQIETRVFGPSEALPPIAIHESGSCGITDRLISQQ
jgi:hypothetical protein